jgi:microcompartment protein CcmL/EutN
MDRRNFLKGTVAAVVAATLPGTEKYTHKTFGTAHYVIPRESLENSLISAADLSEKSLESMCIEIAESRSRALAHSMMQTREHITANVLNRAFGDGVALESAEHPVAYKTWWDDQNDFLHVEGISREQMYVS